MGAKLEGFTIRPAVGDDWQAVREWFHGSQMGWQNVLSWVAWGQPGDVPLGAVVARPLGDGRLGQCLFHVCPEYRRRGVGRLLAIHLFRAMEANKVEKLVLAEVIHEERLDRLFFESMGFTPERELVTYQPELKTFLAIFQTCLLYTSDAADE